MAYSYLFIFIFFKEKKIPKINRYISCVCVVCVFSYKPVLALRSATVVGNTWPGATEFFSFSYCCRETDDERMIGHHLLSSLIFFFFCFPPLKCSTFFSSCFCFVFFPFQSVSRCARSTYFGNHCVNNDIVISWLHRMAGGGHAIW